MNFLNGKDRLQLLIEEIGSYAIFVLDPQGHVLSWNRGAEQIMGYKAEEIIGQHFSTFYPLEAILENKPEQMLARARREGRALDKGWRVRKGGAGFWASVTIAAVSDEKGKLLGFINVAKDTTEEKEAFESLERAFDQLLVAWVHAIQLREVEGRNQQVAQFTVEIARAMGVSEEELVHVRRGALLHDVGELFVPDSILLKPGELSDEEWEIIRHHPVFAYETLSPISFLGPARDIPYCHQERWDGSGYPRGLKGEQIPLAARIFAVVDVWDALSSDRPYRSAWPEEKVLAYIRKQAGKHFDPEVVKIFLGDRFRT